MATSFTYTTASGGVTFVLLKLVSTLVPLRVSREHELEGLDISQHGEALQ
jgi:Amt family ammonium transporter